MPKTQQERSAKAAAKRKALGEEELRHRVRPGIKKMLAELMERHGIKEQAEAIQLLIMNAHRMGPIQSGLMLDVPRHEIEIGENVAQEIYESGRLESIKSDCRDDAIFISRDTKWRVCG